jgi:hypothetical protein
MFARSERAFFIKKNPYLRSARAFFFKKNTFSRSVRAYFHYEKQVPKTRERFWIKKNTFPRPESVCGLRKTRSQDQRAFVD